MRAPANADGSSISDKLAAKTMPILPDALLRAVKSNKCVLFVGSGLSAQAGYPKWSELIATLVEAAKKVPNARTRGIEEYEAAKDYFTLADFARSALGKSQYAALMREQLGRPVRPRRAHKLIATTLYRGLITTNYDKLLETAFTHFRFWTSNAFTPDVISALAVALYNPQFFIFKLHGDIGAPDNIVLTSRDYDRLMFTSPHVRTFLQAIFLNYTVLFVGYSLSDPDFKMILTELTLIFENNITTPYALIPKPPDFTTDHLLERMNIQAIPYEQRAPDDHKGALEVLEELQRAAPFVVQDPATFD